MIKKYGFAVLAMIFFGVGVLLWKHFSKPLPIIDSLSDTEEPEAPTDSGVTSLPELTVGSLTITPDELKWELELHTIAPLLGEQKGQTGLDPITLPKEGESELRDRVISAVLERKIAYLYITEKSKNFDPSDPSRFTKCLSMMADITKENPNFFATRKSRERLKNKLCEQSVIEQFLDERVFNSIVISSTDVASYYRTHEKEFKKPLRVTMRQIVVATEAEAQQLRKEAKPSNFAELARKHSIAPESVKGGLLGPFSKEQLPTLFDIVFSMGIGQISGVIKSDFGFHLIMPIERHPAQTLSLSEASPQIKAEFQRTKKLEAYQKWLGVAMNTIPVTTTPSGL